MFYVEKSGGISFAKTFFRYHFASSFSCFVFSLLLLKSLLVEYFKYYSPISSLFQLIILLVLLNQLLN